MKNIYHAALPPDDAKTPEEAAQKIRNEQKEHLYIFRNGKQIRRFLGEEDRVTPPPEYLFELKNASIAHNHPQGASFSIEDIRALITYDASECWLATEKFLYRLKRPANGWTVDINSELFEKQLNACKSIADDELNRMVAKNEISLHEKEVEIFHYIWVFFFRIHEVEYVRQKST